MSEYASAERRGALRVSGGATMGALAESLNGRASVRAQHELSAIINRGLVQAKWEDAGEENVLKWDSLRNGLQWYYDTQTQNMWFTVEGAGESREDKLAQQHHRMPYVQWLDQTWGERTKTFDTAVEKGKERYFRMIQAHAKGHGSLDEGEQLRRDKAYREQYETDPDGNQFTTTFGGRTGKDKASGHGKYVNRIGFYDPLGTGKITGTITADSNYASELDEPLANNEIFYQQWKDASKGLESKPKLTKLERRHVAGTGVEIGKAIAMAVFGENRVPEPTTFSPPSDVFFALMAMPNAIAAPWLVADHGAELGIKGIESITFLPGKSLDINFKQVEQ